MSRCCEHFTKQELRAGLSEKNCCDKVFLQAYKLIYECSGCDFDNVDKIIKRFSNCFFKAFVKKESDMTKKEKEKSS